MSSIQSPLRVSISESTNLRRRISFEGRGKVIKINHSVKRVTIVSCLSAHVAESRESVAVAKSSQEVMEAEKKVLVGTYARTPVVLVSGKGCKLYDVEGREYLDMSSGIAVNALGHGDEDWVKAVVDQANLLTHVSNVYYSVPQV